MRILNKYVFGNMITGYIFILLIFIGLYFVIDIFSSLSDMLKAHTPLHILLAYYFFMVPVIFLRVSPFALLISSLYTFGELNKTNEIISMRACGLSMFRICSPIIVFALAMAALSFFIQEKVVMESQKTVESIKMQYIKQETKDDELINFAFPYKNYIYFSQRFMPKEGTMENVTIFEEDENGDIIRKVICKRLIYSPQNWKGREVMEYNLDPEGNIFGKPAEYTEKDMDLKGLPQELVSRRTIFNQYSSLKVIRKERKRLRYLQDNSLYSNKSIDYHSKISSPFANFFMLFAALPFAAEIKKRRVTLSSLTTGFVFGFAYYWLAGFSVALAKSGLLLPIIGPWVAPVFFLTMGVTGFLMLK